MNLDKGKGILAISRSSFRGESYDRWLFDEAKRFVDVFGSGVLLAFFFPLMLVTAMLIKFSSPGPVFYCQERLTKNRRVFTIYKFRTMRIDAEAKSGAVLASDNDPRITPLGRFLRLTRIDELPQLINVLIGDMSLIGPRPERPEIAVQLARQLPDFYKRLDVYAGLTGLAQVSSGYASDIESYQTKLALDLDYVRRRSVLLDLKICFWTVKVMITGRGAK